MIKIKYKYKDYVYLWLDEKKLSIKESTYFNYLYIIEKYIIPKLGKYHLKKINYDIVQKYIYYLYNEKKLSTKTIKDIVMVIKLSLKNHNNKVFNYRFNYPKSNEKKMNILTKEEQNILVKYINNNISYKNIGILLSLSLDMRIGEICALKWSDINIDEEIITINNTIQRVYNKSKNESKIIIASPKTINSKMQIPLSKGMLNLIGNKKDDNLYFLTSNKSYIEPRCYRNYFNNILKKLNISHYKFHTLRHTFATNLIEIGYDYKLVSELLGHSNINTTLNIYVHPKISLKKECINELYNKLNNVK